MTDQCPVTPAPAPLEAYAQQFDGLFAKLNQRNGFRRYLEGLLLPTERHKSLTGLANTEPVVGAQHRHAQALQWFLSESTWSERAVEARRLQLLLSDPLTAPTAEGVLAIDEHGDRKDGDHTAHVGRQYLSNLGKIDNGVVSVTSLWADERVYYPVDFEPYTPAHHFAKGERDPAFRTKLKLAVELVRRALEAGFTFRAVVADSFYGEDRGVRQGLRDLQVGYVLALKPSHDWWHPIGSIGCLKEAAHAARWRDARHPGAWVKVVRTFRDGSQAEWWGLEVVVGPYGPHKQHRVVIATTDPETLPDLSTMYLITNLPHPEHAEDHWSGLLPATLEEIVWLYGLRMWVEQSYKQVKHVLGWSEYQVRFDRAMRRHWQLVCCAFSFCWHHLHDVVPFPDAAQAPEQPRLAAPPPEKKARRARGASAGELAGSAAGRAGVAGAMDTAAPLLARVVAGAPTPPTAAPT
jgi:SRSO17 transposase